MIFARAARRGLLAGRGPTVAVDATGLETHHVSAHYRGTRRERGGRRGRPRARYPMLTVAIHTASHLIAGAVTGTGPAPDVAAFEPVMRQAAARLTRIAALVADAGFDAEGAHRLCRGPLGIRRTAIRLNPRGRRRWPATRYRREMRRAFPDRLYRRRQQVESVFSQTKRRLGSALTARSQAAQQAESILRVLTHNLMLLRRTHLCIQQSQSDPIDLAAISPPRT